MPSLMLSTVDADLKFLNIISTLLVEHLFCCVLFFWRVKFVFFFIHVVYQRELRAGLGRNVFLCWLIQPTHWSLSHGREMEHFTQGLLFQFHLNSMWYSSNFSSLECHLDNSIISADLGCSAARRWSEKRTEIDGAKGVKVCCGALVHTSAFSPTRFLHLKSVPTVRNLGYWFKSINVW